MKSRRYRTIALRCLTLCLLAFQAARAEQINLPKVFNDGEPARADEVNANFNTLADESNSQDTRINALTDQSSSQGTRIGVLEQSRFVSNWQLVTRGRQVIINHDLGTLPTHVAVQVANSPNPTVVHMSGDLHVYVDGEGARGVVVTDITATSVRVRTGNSPFCPVFDTFVASGSTNRVCLNTGYARVIVYR